MKIKNSSNSQKMDNKKKLVWNVIKKKRWKAIEKFWVIIICGLHFDRTSRINYEKYDEKCYDQW